MHRMIVTALCACGLAVAADPPYAGKWKMNPAKSNFGETTMTWEKTPDGGMKITADGQSYTTKADGQDVPTPWGSTMAIKAVDDKTWQITEKTNGKVTLTGTTKLSSDGNTLVTQGKRTLADGGTSDETMTLTRVSGGPGIYGKWKTKSMNSSSPETLVLKTKTDGVQMTLGNEGGGCDAKFDGKDYPMKSSLMPGGWTCQIARIGTTGIGITWKKDGKEMYKTTMTASGDGKTLTERGSATAVKEMFSIVYDRQ